MHLTRRAMLAGTAASVATGVWADVKTPVLRPVARPTFVSPTQQLINAVGLSGAVGFVVADAATCTVVEAILPEAPLPPASVTKAFTALYALEHLGAQFQFETCIFADGDMHDGILDGNLILVGGGDPNLLTDDLAVLAQQLQGTGLREVRGDFLIWDEALINLDEIDSTQLDYLGYNPTVSGLNLNFNRVHFEWKLQGGQYATTMDARSDNYRPAVTTSQIEVVTRDMPVFAYRDLGNADAWTVARSALNNAGSRWLPVRHPGLYAGEVFATFARSHGIVLKPPREIAEVPSGASVIAGVRGTPLNDQMRGMLKYSTNITAEAAGLWTTAQNVGQKWGLQASAARMARWTRQRAGDVTPFFADHSGLSDTSRISAGEMVRFLTSPDVQSTLHPIMKPITVVDHSGNALSAQQGEVHAKTGTLNFVSNLGGYMRTSRGRDLAFAIFAADVDARERGKAEGDETPRGASAWTRKARDLQQQLLRHWLLDN